MIAKKTTVKTKVKKDINDSPEVIINKAKMLEQSPKPEAKELRTNNCTLDIILFLNLHLNYSVFQVYEVLSISS
ncbi:hypothetical protein CP500_010420 [Tychonema bourrellyi FEM_GT703]|uniref:Uncharacterized protein n=1 Tax=Tychonema bourrellyi FEM_GT703 TaxID=2040638 RepID=A0A2G4F183_9CYAN|nr:hypothetical protein CP500_010420 [Tychonema bourrellyi FEM_GT703]